MATWQPGHRGCSSLSLSQRCPICSGHIKFSQPSHLNFGGPPQMWHSWLRFLFRRRSSPVDRAFVSSATADLGIACLGSVSATADLGIVCLGSVSATSEWCSVCLIHLEYLTIAPKMQTPATTSTCERKLAADASDADNDDSDESDEEGRRRVGATTSKTRHRQRRRRGRRRERRILTTICFDCPNRTSASARLCCHSASELACAVSHGYSHCTAHRR